MEKKNNSLCNNSQTNLVSVIIPNYNYHQFLERRIESILNQTFLNFEIIFLDDCSTDESVMLVNTKYKKEISIIEVNTKNTGSPFIQWNKGVRLSKGKYIWIAEADDTCLNTFLEKTVEIMENNPSLGIVYCHTLPIDCSDAIIDKNFYYDYVFDLDSNRWHSNYTNIGEDEVKKYLFNKNCITNVSGVLFRKDAYIKAGYAPEDMSMCGDWMFYCMVLRNYSISYLNEPLNFHRQHGVKQTKNSVINLKYFREFLKVQDYILHEFSLPIGKRKISFMRFLNEWDRLVVSNYGKITFSNNLRIACLLFKQYSKIQEKLITIIHLIKNCKKLIFKAV